MSDLIGVGILILTRRTLLPVIVGFSVLGLLCSPIGGIQAAEESSAVRIETNFDRGWLFSRGDFPTAPASAFDDSGWRRLNLPHDWSIEGPFSSEYASGTGYSPGGVGWYRKHFQLDPAATNKRVTLEFDGVYDHAEVWFNGQFVGGRPYGYSTFECDLTPYVKTGSEDNVVAVRVDHSRFADSRWYTGSGIYRHVRLRMTNPERIAQWGTFITTPAVKPDEATVRVQTTIDFGTNAGGRYSLELSVTDPAGQPVARARSGGRFGGGNQVVEQRLNVPNPELWTLDQPRLYTLRSRLLAGSTIVDETATPFGIRTIRFDPNKGFFLNGVSTKLKGVCIHHEAGGLGAAVPDKVLERRLRTLKEMGVNAIRTSHNPPAPELLDLCDRLGFLVKDEAFDEFTPAKNKWVQGRNAGLASHFGYAENFALWSDRDLRDMVLRDRNHPCVVLWSIGNEIDYANDPFSNPILGREYRPENPPATDLVKWGRPLIQAVKQLDQTRPVTAALANVAMSDAVGFAGLLDVTGYNYQESRYASDHARFPTRILFGSETSHQYTNWAVVRDRPYVAGQFLWTGIDYLGEAGRWPNRGSSAGLLDICGFKKPIAWFRQSLWSDRPMVYICASGAGGGRFARGRGEESWNWTSNRTITVICYTTCSEVDLMLNGRLLGTKKRADAIDGTLAWQVLFETGTLKAVGRTDGRVVAEYSLETAGPAAKIELLPDIAAFGDGGSDICHLEYRVVDSRGVRVPDGAEDVMFQVTGPAELLCIENGDLNSPEGYRGLTHRAFRGRGLAVLQSTPEKGRVVITATAPGLDAGSVTLESR